MRGLGSDVPTGKARITVGTREKPGPVLEVDDSLAVIKAALDVQWAVGHYIALVEAKGFRLIVDGHCALHDGGFDLRPAQR